MTFSRRSFFIGGLTTAGAALVTSSASASVRPFTQRAGKLNVMLDSMQVEERWIAGAHVDWVTGLPDGVPVSGTGRHTHCSAFAASLAMRVGVYLLRPPEHGQELLANAQCEWLATEGRRAGWLSVPDPFAAQDIANRGDLVVATYHNHNPNKPGHTGVLRPSLKSDEQILLEGPDSIMASTINHRLISIREGFAGHPSAWDNNEIFYYAARLYW